jgi:tetratricopeptide (TPR) repeat protein
MNLNKLKEAARKYEQREEWRRAIDVYLQAIKEAEEAGEGSQDPALYNRVGDLELKAGDTVAGLRAYEQAAELYAEQGFFNNAIALCQKILRVNPGRTDTYLRLAQLNARKNFVGEAKKNLLEYIERQSAVGQLDVAFNAVKIFADQFSANPDIRLMLVELLRTTSRFKETARSIWPNIIRAGDSGRSKIAGGRLSSGDRFLG